MKLISQRVYCEDDNPGCGGMISHWSGETTICTKDGEGCGRIVTPALWKCDCGEELELPDFTNTCECGADYNSAGQRLAPREQWGEETGESLSDILSIE
jgi:hypothetical protein